MASRHRHVLYSRRLKKSTSTAGIVMGALMTVLLLAQPATARTVPDPSGPAAAAASPSVMSPSVTASGLVVQDLALGATAQALANVLVGAGVTASNATYTGTSNAAGTFVGGNGIVGFDSGVVLGTGSVQTTPASTSCSKGVEGPNECENNTTDNGTAGDAELTALAGVPTNDAAVLEFDFVPKFSTAKFSYVFSSDEYNEFVNSAFNDTFAFFVNGTNCALVPATTTPVSVNTVNGGNPFGTGATNAGLFVNNSLSDPGPASLDTEMDGLTTVLSCETSVNAGLTNHLKLAIADGTDSILDANVFLKRDSFTSKPPPLHGPMCADKRRAVRAELVVRPRAGTTVISVSVAPAVYRLTRISTAPNSWLVHLKHDGASAPAATASVVVDRSGVEETLTFDIPAFTCR